MAWIIANRSCKHVGIFAFMKEQWFISLEMAFFLFLLSLPLHESVICIKKKSKTVEPSGVGFLFLFVALLQVSFCCFSLFAWE